MEYQNLVILITFVSATSILMIFIILKSLNQNSTNKLNLPPGPHPFPIIGNILELGRDNNPHKTLTKLSKIYGPIMTLKLGKITTIVISSPQVAKQVLHENSQIFSSRTVPDAASIFDHHKFSILWLPPSPQWKKLRRICANKVFSPKILDSTKLIRQKKLQELLDYVKEKACNSSHEVVDIGDAVFATILNSISNTLFSMDFAHSIADGKSQEIENDIRGLSEDAGRPNVADFFPILRPLDPQGVHARMTNHSKKIFDTIDGIIQQRILNSKSDHSSMVYHDVLDSVLGEASTLLLSNNDILHLFLDLFTAGIDTTSSTIEWTMAELLHNPDKLRKAKEEVYEAIGKNETLIEESHVSKLPFLQAVVKETLRLHPPAPLLVPRKCDQMVTDICGFNVPKDAQILVNVWAIGRDSSIWGENANMFIPERFLECDINYTGHDFELIPFGAGKRICPGMPLAHRTVHSIVASLVRNFEWKLADGILPQNMNMDEKFGLTLQRLQPLRVHPTSINHG